jgi:hypothetical protein
MTGQRAWVSEGPAGVITTHLMSLFIERLWMEIVSV